MITDHFTASSEQKASHSIAESRSLADQSAQTSSAGRLILNADDWGLDRETTDRTFDCVRQGTVSAVSAMVFMEDSERAAELAREAGVDAGLHLNLTALLTGKNCSRQLADRQRELRAYLLRSPLARIFYHPGLKSSFAYVVGAQLDEYRRLYGREPGRIDGHHHQHLCANVQVQKLLPAGTLVRRNFSFFPGEKRWVNRMYRKTIDNRLACRHSVVDFLFQLVPFEPVARLQRVFSIARQSVVELETHPVNEDEYHYLTSGALLGLLGDLTVAPNFEEAVAEARRLQSQSQSLAQPQ